MNSTGLNHSQVSTKIVEDPNQANPLLSTKVFDDNNTKSTMHLAQSSLKEHHDSQESLIENSNQIEVHFDFGVTSGKILDCFANTGQSLGFNLIEEEPNHATMVKQKKRSLLDLINCLNFSSSSEGVTAIKISIKTNESKSIRTAKLKGLVGATQEVRKFFDEFKIQSKQLKEQQYPNHFESELDDQQESSSNPFQTEVYADYAFYKILSLEKYGLGRKLASDIDSFKHSFQNAEESAALTPLPVKNMYNIIGEVVDSLFKEFNSGRKEMERVMPYCRVSVEKYVCQRLYDTLFPIYVEKTKEMQSQFSAKRQKIMEHHTIKQIFQDIGLQKRHWLVEPQIANHIISSVSRQKIHYMKAAEQFQKIQTTTNIRQKIKFCQLMYTKVKSMIFEQSHGQEELTNIQDILPIVIFIVLLADVKQLRAHLELMNDFLGFQSTEQQSQRRLLTNLLESYNYIRRDWKV